MTILDKFMGKTMKVGSPEYVAWLKAASDEAWREETAAQCEDYLASGVDWGQYFASSEPQQVTGKEK